MEIISRVFAQSPFAPLTTQAEAVQGYLVRIEPLYWSTRSGDADELDRIRAELLPLTAAARRLSDEVHEQIAAGHLLPVRGDRLTAVANILPLVLDSGRQLVGLYQRRRLAWPDEVGESFESVLRLAVQTACLAVELARRVERLIQVGFGGPEMETFRVLLADVKASKVHGDELLSGLEQQLSAYEESTAPSELIHRMRIVGQMGRLMTRATRLACGVHLLVGGRGASIAAPEDRRRIDAAVEARRKVRWPGSSDFPTGDVLGPAQA